MAMQSDNERCGWFGKKTRSSLFAYIKQQGGLETSPKKKQSDILVSTKLPKKEATQAITKKKSKAAGDIITTTPVLTVATDHFFSKQIPYNEVSGEVISLQKKLEKLGYYKEQITGVYDSFTLRAVYAFQLAHNIV
jgi:peptidoglycan hydrolase-like protein with peptidoglycan-binding domain